MIRLLKLSWRLEYSRWLTASDHKIPEKEAIFIQCGILTTIHSTFLRFDHFFRNSASGTSNGKLTGDVAEFEFCSTFTRRRYASCTNASLEVSTRRLLKTTFHGRAVSNRRIELGATDHRLFVAPFERREHLSNEY